jgi:hypothetical protein
MNSREQNENEKTPKYIVFLKEVHKGIHEIIDYAIANFVISMVIPLLLLPIFIFWIILALTSELIKPYLGVGVIRILETIGKIIALVVGGGFVVLIVGMALMAIYIGVIGMITKK